MLFNSIEFAVFLPAVFLLYWLVDRWNLKLQNALIVAASYVFYGWWDWRFLGLIAFSTLVDYCVGIALSVQQDKRKRLLLLWVSIAMNLGFLGFFKYYNFFLDNLVAGFTLLGQPLQADRLSIILPVGISFYTFQTLSYSIDVYKRKLDATKDPIAFAAYVSFFPQLVAGPIERATNLLPQFLERRQFNRANATDGLRQILWGLFKKVVMADNCAVYANMIFENSADHSGSTLLLGAIFFAFQIYGDFSGYSDIAIGTARLFGFNLMQNFAFPYFSRDIAEFWRRWHISLSTWFRDYLYIPLGGSRGGTAMKVRNTFIIFVVSGFWHGANWTFIIWGALNAIYFLPLLLTSRNRQNLGVAAQHSTLPNLRELLQISVTFGLTVVAWIFFRARDVEHALSYLRGLFSSSLFTRPELMPWHELLFIGALILVEWQGRRDRHALERLGTTWSRWMRWGFYYLVIIAILWFRGEQQEFIYFQF